MRLALCPVGGTSPRGALSSVIRQRNRLRLMGASQPGSHKLCTSLPKSAFSGLKQSPWCICTTCYAVPSHSVMSNSVAPWTVPTSLLCPWNFPGNNTGVGCHFLLQGISPTQRLNPHLLSLLHWQADSLSLLPPGKLYLHHGSQQML